MKSRQFYHLLVLLMTGWLLMACQGATAQSGIPEVNFVGKEYSFEGPDTIAGGWNKLTLDNQGELAHDLMLIKLDEGKTTDDVLAALESDGIPTWVSFYGSVTAEPGTKASYLVELPPGSYALMSFGTAEDGPPDAAQGMLRALAVTESKANIRADQLPESSATVELLDFAFNLQNIKGGKEMMQISNIGEQNHELVVYRIKEGSTYADFQTYMEAAMVGEEAAEPPVEPVTAVLLSPGVTEYVEMDWQAGNYIFICHLPSDKHDMAPHFTLGMMQEVIIP